MTIWSTIDDVSELDESDKGPNTELLAVSRENLYNGGFDNFIGVFKPLKTAGFVYSNLLGIVCLYNEILCAGEFKRGQTVTLHAGVNGSVVPIHWKGCTPPDPKHPTTCVVTLDRPEHNVRVLYQDTEPNQAYNNLVAAYASIGRDDYTGPASMSLERPDFAALEVSLDGKGTGTIRGAAALIGEAQENDLLVRDGERYSESLGRVNHVSSLNCDAHGRCSSSQTVQLPDVNNQGILTLPAVDEIDCHWKGKCAGVFAKGENVQLELEAGLGTYPFVRGGVLDDRRRLIGYNAACDRYLIDANQLSQQVVFNIPALDSDQVCSVLFAEPRQMRFTIKGDGTITSRSQQINCPPYTGSSDVRECDLMVAGFDQTIEFKANAVNGHRFTGWTGSNCDLKAGLYEEWGHTLKMDQDRHCQANFADPTAPGSGGSGTPGNPDPGLFSVLVLREVNPRISGASPNGVTIRDCPNGNCSDPNTGNRLTCELRPGPICSIQDVPSGQSVVLEARKRISSSVGRYDILNFSWLNQFGNSPCKQTALTIGGRGENGLVDVDPNNG
jgi:hypothetical protein